MIGFEETRKILFTSRFSDNPKIQNQANEFLFQLLWQSYNFIMASRLDYPRFYIGITEPLVGTYTGPCPDFRYRWAFIDGAQTYRIWGKRSKSRFLDIQAQTTFGAVPAEQYTKLPTSNYRVDKMHLESDGSFEIVASPDYHDGNWIKLDPNQNHMNLYSREAFYDWANEEPSMLRIERVATTPPRSLQWGEAEFIKHLKMAERYLKFAAYEGGAAWVELFSDGISHGKRNAFYPYGNSGVSPGTSHAATYHVSMYDFSSDEALIIESDVPRCEYWSLTFYDRFGRAPDFIYHQTSLNGHQARIDSDGKFRAVISQQDPGVPNWLDASVMKPEGIISFRQYYQEDEARKIDIPMMKKVPFREIKRNLPSDTPLVSPDDRTRQVRDRSWAMLSLYGY